MTLARVAVLFLVAVLSAGCFGSSGHRTSIRTSKPSPVAIRFDLAAARAALANGSGILAPFRPARLGRYSCTIPRGGFAVKLLRGTCETRVLHRAGERLVIFSERWSARDFRGSGGKRFRQAGSRRRLQTSWLVTVTLSGRVRQVRISGDFAPQFVM
jgi:hypothetical protein